MNQPKPKPQPKPEHEPEHQPEPEPSRPPNREYDDEEESPLSWEPVQPDNLDLPIYPPLTEV